MAFLSAFIGIDRFADPGIRDLAGCRRDALALWALFGDTVPDARTELLLDHEATLARVRAALSATLDGATKDDVVFVSFSGHGSTDHRLVLHDTDRTRLPETALGMGELAEAFKRSQAKAILCVLDCCFSGGAPARVVEAPVTPRDPGSPLETLGGEGRILIAAANVNELAYELAGHGLLTGALLDALQAGSEAVSLVSAMDAVMKTVRAEAARMGYVQTPVLYGYVQGGLTLPVLRKGDRYLKAFPNEVRSKVTGALDDLTSIGIPAEIVEAWREQIPTQLNALQVAAINEHGILDGKSLVVVAPTSSGKTFIGELAAARASVRRRRSVFLFPYKALTNEKHDQFQRTYGGTLGLRVIRCTGDFQDDTNRFVRGKYDLAVLTYEMFLGLVLSNPGVVELVDVVVVDEAQFIADPKRGIVVELLLTYLLTARDRGITPQIVALSAVIGDLNGFDQWLGGNALVTYERPVPLVEGVLDRSGRFHSRAADGTVSREQLLPPGVVIQRRDKPSAQDVIVPLVRQLLAGRAEEKVIVFRNARGPAEGCAAYLAKDLGLPPASDVIEALPTTDPSSASRALRECLQGGTAFHNANLLPEERVAVERAFRRRDGPIRALAATTTVAAGINTPASTVVLAEQEFFGEDGRPFTVAEYKNMAGRAGRLGYNERGRAIILADDAVSPGFLLQKYVLADPEPLRSSFDVRDQSTWVLRLLTQVKEVPRGDVVKLVANTYGGYVAGRGNPAWRSATERSLEGLLAQMIELGLAEEDGGLVRLTLLGRVCGRSSLSFNSALRLVRALKANHGSLTAEQLLVSIQVLPESDAVTTPLMKKGQAESRWPRDLAATYGREAATALQANATDTNTYRARCKRAMVVRSWIEGVPMEQVEADATTNPYQGKISSGHVRQFADVARFHLRAAFEIASVILVDKSPTPEDIETLICRLEFGIPSALVTLVKQLPVPIQRGDLLALGRQGITTLERLWSLTRADLRRLVSTEQADLLEKRRPAARQADAVLPSPAGS
jgi:replicative superfamily II helicase